MASRSAGFGSGFAQGLGQVLAQLPQLMMEQQKWDLQKQLLESQVKVMNAEQQRQQAAFGFIASHPDILKQLMVGEGPELGSFYRALAGETTPTPGPEAPAPAPTNVIPGVLGQAQAGTPAAPPAVDNPAATAPSGPAGFPPMAAQGYDFNPLKPWDMTFKMGRNTITTTIEKQGLPDGTQQYMAVLSDQAGRIKAVPVPGLGPPVPPAEIQQAEAAVRSYGAPDGAVKGLAGAWLAARALPDPDAQTAALQRVEAQATSLAELAKQYPEAQYDIGAPGIAGAVEEGTKMAAQREAAKTEARQRAENVTRPLTGEQLVKYNNALSLGRSLDQVLRYYDQKFVGKGISQFMSDVQTQVGKAEKEIATGNTFGGLGGKIREFTGQISPEEALFRKAIVNASNQLLYALSGQQINESEYQRLKAGLFSALDEPAVFQAGLRMALEELDAKVEDISVTGSTPIAELPGRKGKKDSAATVSKPSQKMKVGRFTVEVAE